jgi:PAS domain S-box-containing protein
MNYAVIISFTLGLCIIYLCYYCFCRKRAESALHDLIDRTNIGYYKCRARDGVVLSANQGFVRILDLDMNPADVSGRAESELVIYLDDNFSIRDHVRAKGHLSNFEYIFRTLKGRDKRAICNAYMFKDPYAREDVVVALIEDVTEERASYEKMRESQERYEKLFKSSSDMVVVFRFSDLRMQEINPVTEIIMGYDQEDMLKKTFDEFIHPSCRDGFRDALRDLLFAGSAVLETVLVTKPGEYKDVMLTLNAIDMKEERIVLAMVKDVSSIVKEREEEALRKKEMEDLWKGAVEREERIKELRSALEKAEKKISVLKGKDAHKEHEG